MSKKISYDAALTVVSLWSKSLLDQLHPNMSESDKIEALYPVAATENDFGDTFFIYSCQAAVHLQAITPKFVAKLKVTDVFSKVAAERIFAPLHRRFWRRASEQKIELFESLFQQAERQKNTAILFDTYPSSYKDLAPKILGSIKDLGFDFKAIGEERLSAVLASIAGQQKPSKPNNKRNPR